ncbi:hypothetical protein D3C74_415190 [compost metagenome]
MSEGQSIIYSILSFFDFVIKKASDNKDKTIVILLDEVDSGLSVENINMLLHIINDMPKNTQFFISTNQYHWVYAIKRGINMYNGEQITINSYDEFFNLLTSNMQELGQKRKMIFMQSANWIE